MFLPARVRDFALVSAIQRRSEFYSEMRSDSDRATWQLNALNREWGRILREVPYYRDLRHRLGLPERFSGLEEFSQTVPAVGRTSVQRHGRAMSSPGRPDFFRTTGGSTAEPVQLPAWQSEYQATRPDTWTARQWYGVRPSSRQFMIWGHSHLWGRGIQGRLRALDRKLRDRLLGYYRFSAYDLSADKLRQAARDMLRFRPEYLLGYSVALDFFARSCATFREELLDLRLKMVTGAAEAFPAADSTQILNDLFGCPVAMEYGSVESFLIAHTVPKGGYDVFWHSYLLQVDPVRSPSGGRRVFLTSLYPRCFPLVRYELGDEIELQKGYAPGVYHFTRVIGRCNSSVTLTDGTVVHSEAFTHAVRAFQEVLGYQIAVEGDVLSLRLILDNRLPPNVELSLRQNLRQIHCALERIPIVSVSRFDRTVAGKTPVIVYKA